MDTMLDKPCGIGVGSFVACAVVNAHKQVLEVWNEEMTQVLGSFPIDTPVEIVEAGLLMYVVGLETGEKFGRIKLQREVKALFEVS